MAKYPILYPPDADDFFNLGLGPLKIATKSTVTEERNGAFILEATVQLDDVIYPMLEEGMILKADAGHELKDQRFTLKRIVPNSKEQTATLYAEHVSYVAAGLPMEPEVIIQNQTAANALRIWKEAILDPNDFVMDSDIETAASTRWRIDKVENPRQALGGVSGSILDTYGGEYRFDNFHISLLKKRGKTANTIISYGRNLISLEQERNIADTYTSVHPFAIYTKDEKETLVTGDIVDSENVASFTHRNVKPVDFSGEFDDKNPPTKVKLNKLAEAYVKANQFGVPKVSIKVNFLDLSKTADYADVAPLEEVNLCDDVFVRYPKLGISSTTKVIRTVWNVLTETYDEIELGEKRVSLSTIISETQKQAAEANTQSNYALIAANGKNTIFYGLYGDDGLGEPTATMVGDLWFKPDGTDTDLYQWNGTIWEEILSTAKISALEDEVNNAIQEQEEIKQSVIEAYDNAVAETERQVKEANETWDQNMETVKQEFHEGLDEVNAKTDQAVNEAKQAAQAADLSSAAAQKAEQIASGLGDDIDQANANAKEALDGYKGLSFVNRQFLLGTANEMIFKGNGSNNQTGITIPFSLGTLADCGFKIGDQFTFKMSVKISGSGFAGEFRPQLSGNSWTSLIGTFRQVTKVETIEMEQTLTITSDRLLDNAINVRLNYVPNTVTFEILQYSTKFEKGTKSTDWSYAPEDTFVEIKNLGDEVRSKVSQQTFDVLNGKVLTVETVASQNKKEIAQKASQTQVNTITGQVSAVQSTLSTQAGQITALNTKTDGHTTQIGSLETSYSKMSSTISTVQTELGEKATVTQFSNLSQTVSTLQGTVSGKASVAQVTLLENQVTSIVAGQTRNLLKNSDFRNGTASWSGTGMSTIPLTTATQSEKLGTGADIQKYIRVTKASLAGVTAYPLQTLADPNQYRGKKLRFALNYITIGGGFTSGCPMQAVIRYTLDGADYYVRFTDRSDNYLELSNVWKRVDCLVDFTGVSSTQEITDIRLSLGFTEARFLTDTQRIAAAAFLATEDGNLYDWGYDYVRSQSYSQITQLQELIDLRVTKDGVLTAISLSPETVRILGKRIQLDGDVTMTAAWMTKLYADSAFVTRFEAKSIDAVSANITSIITSSLAANTITGIHLKIDNALIDNLFATSALIDSLTSKAAFITDIKAIEISASKVTTGTLNAANVAIINLDASNITTGVLTAIRIQGPSLIINLATGNVEFGKGRISGLNSFWDLNTGKVSFTGGMIGNTENTYFNLDGKAFGVGNVTDIYGNKYSIKINSSGITATQRIGSSNFYNFGDFSGSEWRLSQENVATGSVVNFSRITMTPANIVLSAQSNISTVVIDSSGAKISKNLTVVGSKNAIHPTRFGVVATPAYETAESYLGDLGRAVTDNRSEVWVPIEEIFRDTVNTDIAYEVFLQAYDDARFWIADFRSDCFLVRSDRPFVRFGWELKAKRRGYENDRLVYQDGFDNKKIEETWRNIA